MTDQVFESAVRAKIAKLEKACDGWRKEALELSKEIEKLQKERDELKQNIRDMHDYMHKRIEEALAKVGADKTGEV